MTPYFDDGQVALYLGDMREVVHSLPRDSVDLIVTDPPYGQRWQSGYRRTSLPEIVGDDGTLDVAGCITAACRVLREGRHLYVFGPADLSSCPIGGTTELIWDKEIIGPGDLTQPWGPQHETITFAVHVSRASNRARGNGRLAARLRKGSVLRQRPEEIASRLRQDARALIRRSRGRDSDRHYQLSLQAFTLLKAAQQIAPDPATEVEIEALGEEFEARNEARQSIEQRADRAEAANARVRQMAEEWRAIPPHDEADWEFTDPTGGLRAAGCSILAALDQPETHHG